MEISKSPPPHGAVDLGDLVILPGLVNAHTHLEFSDLTAPVGQPNMRLSDWIGEVVRARQSATTSNQQSAIASGLKEVAACGTRLVGEIATPPCEYPIEDGLLEVISFAEVLGLATDRSSERLEAALAHCSARDDGAVSPHAPYSTRRETIERCVALARSVNAPLAMHVAESPDERSLLTAGAGPFAQSLQRMGVWKPGLFPWGPDPLCWLIEQLAEAPRGLLIHGNDLVDSEIARLASHPHLSVVYCPRTHSYFGYDPHPVAKLGEAQVNVALGTDSRASNPDLNVWREVQFLLNHRQDLSPQSVLRMGTINGARALGRESRIGRLAAGCEPGLGSVAVQASTIEKVYERLAEAEYQPILEGSDRVPSSTTRC